MSATYFAINPILNKLFTNSTLTQPSTYYFGFSSSPIAIDGSGYLEPTTGNYSRVGISSSTGFTTSTLGTLSNSTAITFPESTAPGWGVALPYVAVWDASSAGNIWYFGTLSSSITVAAFTTVYFAISGVTISMTN